VEKPHKGNKMAKTIEEINAEYNAQLKSALTGVVSSVKTYVDGKDEVLKSEISELVVKELSDIDGLGEQLSKIQEMADAFSKAFDGDEDGKITPEEILAKAVLLQQAIDGVNSRVTSVEEALEAVKTSFTEELKALEARIGAAELNIAQNRDEVASLKADVETNYVTEEALDSMQVDVDGILGAVNDILFPSAEAGDGAVE